MFTVGMELKLIDLVNDDLNNKMEVYSDAVEILKVLLPSPPVPQVSTR